MKNTSHEPRHGEPDLSPQEWTAPGDVPFGAMWLEAETAAVYVKLSPSTLAKLRMGDLGPPYTKAGRKVLYRLPDLDAWLLARMRRNTSQP